MKVKRGLLFLLAIPSLTFAGQVNDLWQASEEGANDRTSFLGKFATLLAQAYPNPVERLTEAYNWALEEGTAADEQEARIFTLNALWVDLAPLDARAQSVRELVSLASKAIEVEVLSQLLYLDILKPSVVQALKSGGELNPSPTARDVFAVEAYKEVIHMRGLPTRLAALLFGIAPVLVVTEITAVGSDDAVATVVTRVEELGVEVLWDENAMTRQAKWNEIEILLQELLGSTDPGLKAFVAAVVGSQRAADGTGVSIQQGLIDEVAASQDRMVIFLLNRRPLEELLVIPGNELVQFAVH